MPIAAQRRETFHIIVGLMMNAYKDLGRVNPAQMDLADFAATAAAESAEEEELGLSIDASIEASLLAAEDAIEWAGWIIN